MPALVGYLLAGILVSPSVFGFDVDLNLANQLAEIGIMLLMFGVGLHFSLTDLLKVKGLVVPGAICQMLLSALIGFGLSWLWGWDVGHSVLLGRCLSCASTVVVLKALEARGMLEGFDGNVAVGWLIVQDMVTVLLLVLLPPMASVFTGQAQTSSQPLWRLLLITLAQVVVFIVLMLVVSGAVCCRTSSGRLPKPVPANSLRFAYWQWPSVLPSAPLKSSMCPLLWVPSSPAW